MGLIKALLNITQKQWIYRNSDIHYRFDGLTTHQHSLLSERIHNLIRTSPADLLPCHRHLLQQYFHQLGSDITLKCQLWVASMDSAISTASHVASGHHTPGSLQAFYSLPTQAHPKKSPFTSPRPFQCPHQPSSHSPRQQSLPVSFWVSEQSHLLLVPPPEAHTTDLTGARFHLHWQRKRQATPIRAWSGLNAFTCEQECPIMDILLPQCDCSAYMVEKKDKN